MFLVETKAQSNCPLRTPQLTNLETTKNPLYIPIRYYFLLEDGDNWIGQTAANLRAKNSIAMLNGIFNDQGIYFVPFDGGCSGSIEARILPIQSPGSGELISEYVRENYSDVKLENVNGQVIGIEVYVRNGIGVEGTSQHAGDRKLPSTTITATGLENGLHSIETPVFTHEVGHAFGLLHTHETGCSCLVSDGCDCSNPDYCTGDFIATTPLHTNLPTTIPCDGSTNSQNFMSYTDNKFCRTKFESEQYNRMRAHLENDPFFAALPVYKPLIYNQGVPFTLPAISGNIVVQTGELVIPANQTLEMLPGASITVNKGAKLSISGTITGACGQMWRGVIVDGQPAPQTLTNQGLVFFGPTAKIEHARIGIDAESQTLSNGGGGIVVCSGGTFVNNTVGIRFGPYFGSIPNLSRVTRTKFTVNNEYRAPDKRVTHIDLNGVTGMVIWYAEFLEERTLCNSTTIGIDSDNASFRALQGNIFENLNIGIKDYMQNQLAAFEVEGCTFRNCDIGIETTKHSGFKIEDNNFLLGPPANCSPANIQPITVVTGIKLEGLINGFSCTRNTFDNPFNQSLINAGTSVKGIGDGVSNNISNNTYNDLFYGNVAEGDNGYNPVGLKYDCNTHNGVTVNIQNTIIGSNYYIVGNTSSIQKTQGSISTATGNLFGSISNNFGRFNNASNNQIEYYYVKTPDGREDPKTDIDATTLIGCTPTVSEFIASLPNENCGNSTDPCPDPPCDEILLNNTKAHFYAQKNLWIAKKDSLSLPLDNNTLNSIKEKANELRIEMNADAAFILKHYRQDTTMTEIDSILAWLYRTETFGTRFELARYYYFNGNLTAFDHIWNRIPVEFTDESDDMNIWSRSDGFYQHFRGQIVANPRLVNLSASDIQYLNGLLNDCDEAGFAAKIVLWRNGIDAQPVCDHTPILQRNNAAKLTPASTLRLMPNPAHQIVEVFYPTAQVGGTIMVFDLHGRTVAQTTFEKGQSRAEIPVHHLSAGVYVVYWTDGNSYQQQKLVVQH